MRLEDAIPELAGMPAALEKRATGLSDDQLRYKLGSDTFSVLENVCHLRDIEVEGYARRLGLLLREDDPLLPDLNGSVLARERRYNEQPLRPALDAFTSMRRRCLATLADVTPEELTRRGRFENVGPVTLGRLLELWIEHDQEHLRDLDQLLPSLQEPFTARPSKPTRSLRT
jgi:hypothetical protein